jgi:hypothetical protein
MALARVVQERTAKSRGRPQSVHGRRPRECGAFLACDTRPPDSADPDRDAAHARGRRSARAELGSGLGAGEGAHRAPAGASRLVGGIREGRGQCS